MKTDNLLVERANEEVNIFAVLNDFFNIDMPEAADSYKGYCPFGFEHGDGGIDKGWRTYSQTNSSYCFVMHGSLPPVRLISLLKGWTYQKSAAFLLEHYGLIKPKNYRLRYNELLMEKQRTQFTTKAQATYIVEALNNHLTRLPNYSFRKLAGPMEAVLAKLDALMETNPSEEEIRTWYERAKRALETALADT